MGVSSPYGYRKDPNDKNHLVIDEKTAPVVRKMFELALEGNGIGKIRKYLNSQQILRPAAYAAENGCEGYNRHFEDSPENRYNWSENSVRSILRSSVYAGNLTGYKRPTLNMKSKKRPSRLPEEWETVSNTHESIVTQEEFDTVQRLMTSRRKEKNSGYDNVFLGIVKCADCGYALRASSANRRKRPELIDCIQYACNNYGRYGNVVCTSHTIEARDLINAVLADINHYANMAINDKKAIKTIGEKLSTIGKNEVKTYESEQRKLRKRLAELDRLFTALYEDRVMEKITERNYGLMSEKYEKEQLEIENRLKEIESELIAKGKNDKGVEDFISLIQKYKGITELTAAIVNTLIGRITVSEREKNEEGNMEQHIKIYYKFVGSLNDFSIQATDRYADFVEDKECVVCGTMFRPTSNVAKYCPTCREIKEQENNAKQNERRMIQRGGRKLLPKPCECCGADFTPKSHNARFCTTCYPIAKANAHKQWSKEYYQQKKEQKAVLNS